MSQVVFYHEADELHASDDRASALVLELYTSQALERSEAATRLRSSMLTASTQVIPTSHKSKINL